MNKLFSLCKSHFWLDILFWFWQRHLQLFSQQLKKLLNIGGFPNVCCNYLLFSVVNHSARHLFLFPLYKHFQRKSTFCTYLKAWMRNYNYFVCGSKFISRLKPRISGMPAREKTCLKFLEYSFCNFTLCIYQVS